MIARTLLLVSLGASPAVAQVAPDTLRLSDVRNAAAAHDPRSAQPALLEEASGSRLAGLRAESLPALALSGQATYQDAVATVPIELPVEPPSAPLEQFRIQLEAEQLLYDGGRLARRADIERARLAETHAGARAALHAIREAATRVFFGALLHQHRAAALALTAEDLGQRLTLVRARAHEGAALPADAALVEAELIRVRQQAAEAEADRLAALRVLESLTGLDVGPGVILDVPDDLSAPLDVAVQRAGRPEFGRFAGQRDRAIAEAGLARAAALPDVRLFGQAGVGRPGPFSPFDEEIDPFAIVGVRLRWMVLDWGRSRREAHAARLQARVAETEAEAFALQLSREAEDARADVARLEAIAAEDDRAVALREEVLRVARLQFDEGVLLVSDYVDRLTDLAEARLSRSRHAVELALARATLLSTLGRFPGESP